jgi:hypothetical protein
MKKKLFVFFMIVGMTIPVFAHGHHHHHGSDGVRLATDIVNLVGASLNIIIPRPVVVAPAPVVQPTVVVPPPVSYVPVAPVYTYPVVPAPLPRPIYHSEYRGHHPPPRRHPHPGGRHHRR